MTVAMFLSMLASHCAYRGVMASPCIEVEAPIGSLGANWTWSIGGNQFRLEFFSPVRANWTVRTAGAHNCTADYPFTYTSSENAHNLSTQYKETHTWPQGHCGFTEVAFVQLEGQTAKLWFEIYPSTTSLTIAVGRQRWVLSNSTGEWVWQWGPWESANETFWLTDTFAPGVSTYGNVTATSEYVHLTAWINDLGYYGLPFKYSFSDQNGTELPIRDYTEEYRFYNYYTVMSLNARFSRSLWTEGSQVVNIQVEDCAGNVGSGVFRFSLGTGILPFIILILIAHILIAQSLAPKEPATQRI